LAIYLNYVKLLHENHQEIGDGWGGHVKKERQFVVVPRFILDEIFGLMAVFFFGWWGVCLGGPAGGVHVLSNSLVVMSLQFF
jgi:hypothetical protein